MHMTGVDLKPCPFCGGKVIIKPNRDGTGGYAGDTGNMLPNWKPNARFIAAARTLVPAMADRIEELEASLAEADDFIAAQAKDHNSNNIRLAEMAHSVKMLQAKLVSAVATIAELTRGQDD